MAEREERLVGGSMSEVVRVGCTVRRPWTSSSPTVQELLAFLRAAGLPFVPSPGGRDDQGREIVEFIPGSTAITLPLAERCSSPVLTAVASAMRSFHDASAGFPPSPGVSWRPGVPDPGPVEVICHNDWSPDNVIVSDTAVIGVLDWDFAGPGSRLWDLAYAAFTWLPLADLSIPRVDRLRLLDTFAVGYGDVDQPALLRSIIERLRATAVAIRDRAAQGDAVYQRFVSHGIPVSADADAAIIEHLAIPPTGRGGQ